MRARGWPYPFAQQPWVEISSQMNEMAAIYPGFRHMAAIVDSVFEAGMTDALAAFTSHNDLMVVSTPIRDLPYDLVAVRAPGSHRRANDGCLLIEHLSVTGLNDAIERPVVDAVPLFWRFIIEKFAITPNWPAQPEAF